MIDIAMNQQNDLVFENQDLNICFDVDEVKQAVRIVLQTRLGEFFADENMGLNTTNIFQKKYDEQLIASALTDAVEEDKRVTSVDKVNLDIGNDRVVHVEIQFTIDYTIQTGTEVSLGAE